MSAPGRSQTRIPERVSAEEGSITAPHRSEAHIPERVGAEGCLETAPHILVVDDDSTTRLLMRAALRKSGFDVTLAVDGDDGLRAFRARRPDLVMLDVDMPGLDGFALCRVLRAEAGPAIPLVVVTGMDDIASVGRAYECGATDFIAKPIHWVLISHRVHYLLRSYRTLIELQAAQDRQTAILNAIPDLLFEIDLDGRYVDFHCRHPELLVLPVEQLLGRPLAEAMPRAAADTCLAALHEAHLHGSSAGHQFELVLPQGVRWFELSVARKPASEGARPHFIVLSRDISARKEAESHVARLAYVDGLTGLPNRLAFLARVDREIRRAALQRRRLAVLFMDLDGFKSVNDTLGHMAGDTVLRHAANRLREGLRPSDLLARSAVGGELELARLGGDEFTVLIVDVEQPEDAMLVARRIGELMRQPFDVDTRSVTLSTSVGVAFYPEDGQDGATLLKHADTAMYHAKNCGRDNVQLYSADLTAQAMRRMELDASLRVALDVQQFHLVYQPQIDVDSLRMRSCEALIRWEHPQRGTVSPLEFIPLAEQNGLIERIGRWVLRTACHDAARWYRDGYGVCVAVNLSPLQFRDSTLLAMVDEALALSGLPPALLEVELTESALMANTAIDTLGQLRARGVGIALDDFGTGYSSLSYLTRMPINRLKIDRCFVDGMLDGDHNDAIVRAMLAMAASLGLHVTAEGVETRAQARALRVLGCDTLQGELFSRPVPASDIASMWRRTWTLDANEGPQLGLVRVG